MKKGQMFILTMVFLIGLVFVIQQSFMNWFAYSIDFYANTQRNDYYTFNSIRQMSQATLLTSPSCTDARESFNDMTSFLQSRVLSGYFLEYSARLNCAYWNNPPPQPPPLNVTIHVTGKGLDSYSNFNLYRT